ncbi:MAG: spore gernimation protein GerK [Clostridiales bacterium GWB2_37_7]|nr:MAG: spore gernimation protein GerK [Clostridiales bacterium GWB2_37_7]
MNADDFLNYLRQRLTNSFDVSFREIQTDKGIIYAVFDGIATDKNYVSEFIIAPLMKCKSIGDDVEKIKKEVISANTIIDVAKKEDGILFLLSGCVLLILPFFNRILSIEAKGYKNRNISIPVTEAVIKGPRQGFVEDLATNASQIRRIIKNADLKFEKLVIGNKSNTTIAMVYINGLAPQKLIDQVRENLTNFDLDFALSSNYIEERLKAKYTAFDTVGYTEKPDVAASKIAEGRIAILSDGTPFVITVPYFFAETFQAPDDYYMNIFFANMARWLRYFAFGLATLMPGFYVALVTYHFSLIPSVFTFRLAVSRAGIPFPTIIEVYMLYSFFMFVREGSIRLPQPLGSSMSIVGALILGDALVASALASNVTLIVIALSSITSFLVPRNYGALSIWAIIIIFFSSLLGLPGFYIGFILLCSHITGLKTCGYPFAYPLGTLKEFKFRDIVVRGRLDKMATSVFAENKKVKR